MNKKVLIERLTDSSLSYEKAPQDKPYLGVLKGVCADLSNPTRNNRTYSEKLWENVVNNNEFKELSENKVLYGELGHPEDRLETLIERAAIQLAGIDFDKSSGKLIGTFHILPTPHGQILKALVDYGSKIGVSSRGGGEIVIREGKEYVDEDTFDFKAFDAVILPAVKDARPELVTESKQNTKFQLLTESVKSILESIEDNKEKKALLESLDSLESPEIDSIKGSLEIVDQEDNLEAESDRSGVIKDLQKSIQTQLELEEEIAELREKVSAGSTRELKLAEELEKVKSTVRRLSLKTQEQNKIIENKTSNTKELERVLVENNNLKQELSKQKRLLKEDINNSKELLNDFKETLLEQERNLKEKDRTIRALQESFKSTKESFNEDLQKQRAITESLKKDHQIELNKAAKKLNESKEVSKYLNSKLNEALNSYIKVLSRQNGLEVTDIKNKLSENYSIKEINEAVERLTDFKIRIGSLPFAADSIKAEAVSKPIMESIEPINEDTEVSPALAAMLRDMKK